MKVLMLSQDMSIFEEGSSAALRMTSYEALADELTVLVFGVGERKEKKLASNVHALKTGGADKFDAYIRGWRELFSLVQKKRPDVLSSQDPFFIGFAGLVAARLNRIPFQAQLHTDCFSFAFASQSPRQFIETILAFFVVQGASCVRVVSKRLARSIAKFSSIFVTVLPIRVPDISKEKTPIPGEFSNRLTIVSVARMTKEKQLHLLIDAVGGIPEVDLIIVGDGQLRKNLELRVRRLGLSSRVKFAGWQNPHPYYAHAQIFVSMSRFEGYGIALMEAAFHGLAIVSTHAGIVGDVLRDGLETIVVPSNAGALREALERLIRDGALRTSLGTSARKRAEAMLVSESEYLLQYRQALLSCASKTAS